jgi:hypothetical protein
MVSRIVNLQPRILFTLAGVQFCYDYAREDSFKYSNNPNQEIQSQNMIPIQRKYSTAQLPRDKHILEDNSWDGKSKVIILNPLDVAMVV